MIDKHISTPNFGLGRGDRIDQLIEESDRQLKTLPNKPAGDSNPLKSDTSLQSNPSFQEMLQQLENFDAAVASGSGVAPTKYDQAFFSALRTMLRECLFTKNPLMRKSHIDRIYAWFQQKKAPASNSETAAKAQVVQSTKQTTHSISEQEREMRRLRYMSKLRNKDAAESLIDFAPIPAETLSPRIDQEPQNTTEQEVSTSMEAKPACERVKEYKMRNLRVAQMRRQGIPMAAIRAAETAVKKQAEKKAHEAIGISSISEVERAIRELWIKKRQEEEQDRRSEVEVKEAMQWWAKNRARTEEEISRRQESIRFASQTAKIHGRRDSISSTVPATNKDGGMSPISVKGEAHDESFVTDMDENDDIEIIEDLMHEKYVLPEKFLKTPQLRAPYDGLRTSTTDAGWSLTSPARPISARLAGRSPGAAHNFGSPLPADTSGSPTRTMRAQSAKARFASSVPSLNGVNSISTYDQGSGLPQKPLQEPFDLHGFLSPHKFAGSRPPSSYHGSYAATPRETPRGGSHSTEPAGAGITRRAVQLAEVDRIKRAFAKSRIVCPLNIIERALTVPDDRSYAKCVDLLPRPGSNLLKNPITKEKKGKPAKKGAGKKGKAKKK